jgi:plastocyanin
MTHSPSRIRIAFAGFACLIAGGLLGAPLAARAAALNVTVTDAAGKPLEGAVVLLEPATGKVAVKPMADVEISQSARQFHPRVTLITTGTRTTFPNFDTVRHHVYSFSPTKRFEIKLYVGTPAAPVVFDQPGIAVLGCNIHDQMAAWIVVVDTPWFGRTDDNGRWAGAAAPPGRYTLRTWHAGLPAGAAPVEQALTVEPSGTRAEVRLAALKT